MYGKISLKDYAGHANLPLPTVYVRQGSAATIGFLDVPDAATSVSFTAVNVAGTALTVAAAKVDGIWTATLPASHFAAAGNVENGITIKASDGTSEWTLGVGGLVVLSAEATPAPGETATNITDKTLDGEEIDTGTVAGLRAAVRKLGGALGATVTALALCVHAMPLQDIPVTNDVYTAAETDAAIIRLAPAPGNYNAVSNAAMSAVQPALLLAACTASSNYTDKAIAAMPSGGIATNDVCAIVTNAVQTDEWTYGGLPDGAVLYYPPEYSESQECWMAVMTYNGTNYDGTSFVGPDATDLVFKFVDPEGETSEEYIVTATLRRPVRNALGLAREEDLPQNAPVDEIRFNGADGKVYHLRIGAGGSVDVYTEVAQ